MSDDGWRPLQVPEPEDAGHDPASRGEKLSRSWSESSPFVRVARVHAASLAGDAMVAVGLASSLFFDIDPSAARTQILLYLAVTMAPFAVVGPFIGPVLDRIRGGRRTALVAINILRVATAFLMLPVLDELLLFPVAFAHLVLSKSYHVAKASIVPTTVRSDAELVEKNSRLAVLSGVAGFVGAAPAVAANFLVGPELAVAFAMATYGAAVFLSWQLPEDEAVAPGSHEQATEVRSRGISLASSAMAMVRAIVGFMFWLVAFAFRGGTDDVDLSGVGTSIGAGIRTALGYPAVDESVTAAWKLGVVLAFSAIGTLAGSVLAPRVRERLAEEDMILGALTLMAAVGGVAAWIGGLNGAGLLALVIGLSASGAKVAFDAIVQRDAPHADYASSFARFESKFQLAWVVGALIPVVPPSGIQPRLGFVILAVAALVATVWYFAGTRGENYGTDAPAGAVVERLRDFFHRGGSDPGDETTDGGEVRQRRQRVAAPSGARVGASGAPATGLGSTGEVHRVPEWVSSTSDDDPGGNEPTIAMPAQPPRAAPPAPPDRPPAPPDPPSVFDRPPAAPPDGEPMWDDHR